MLTTFAKSSILNVWQGFEYASANYSDKHSKFHGIRSTQNDYVALLVAISKESFPRKETKSLSTTSTKFQSAKGLSHHQTLMGNGPAFAYLSPIHQVSGLY